MTRITSTSNLYIKRVRALRHRKERDRTGLCLVEGGRAVREAVDLSASVETLIVAPDLLRSWDAWRAVRAYQAAGGRTTEVSGAVFESLSSRERPQGLAAVVRQRWEDLPECVSKEERWVALYGVQHPGNLGAVLRTCDASGAAGVILLGTTTDPYDPVSLRASMGTAFSQRLIRASIDAFLPWSDQTGCMLIGAAGDGVAEYRSVIYRQPLVLLMGAERRGLPPELRARCDAVARIPMVGRADSLNLAVATALLLYEAFQSGAVSDRH